MQIELECEDFLNAIVNTAGLSDKWELFDLKCHVADVVLDSSYTESFASMLVTGQSILIPFQANEMQKMFIPAGANVVDLTLAKQYSR